jgi:acyl dehydratase
MAGQLYYEDVTVGADIPRLVKRPTTEQLVRYAGATDDYARIHYDEPYARFRGFPSVIVHGLFKATCLGQMVCDWAGPRAWVKKMSTQYRHFDLPGHDLVCKGRVTDKVLRDGQHLVELEIWT